jgi:hypothetical protein
MPPAFVLSQDQTLMFNPQRTRHRKTSSRNAKFADLADPTISRQPDRPTRAVTTLTSLIRKRRDNPPPPAHPFSLPTMSINKPVNAARRSEPADAGGGL